jgi:hypothetical protein
MKMMRISLNLFFIALNLQEELPNAGSEWTTPKTALSLFAPPLAIPLRPYHP